jgi:hypothetical protein
MSMDAKARRVLTVIRDCVAAERCVVLPHFTKRMDERAFFWPDVLAVIDSPSSVRDDGRDRFGRPKWVVAGKTADDLEIELVCAIDTDDRGRLTVFITIY